jgi:hypothetical protein
MNPIPTPETLSGYEKLGTIGILLLVLAVGLAVITWAVRRFSQLAAQAFEFVQKQTEALTGVRDSIEQQHETQSRLHERLDALFSCTRAGCPVFEMRKKQQKDASEPSP